MAANQKTRRRPALDRVIRAADRLFYQEGIKATGVDSVAREADVSKATLYTYYRTKDDLAVDYLRRRSSQWQLHMSSELNVRAGTALDRIGHVYDVLGAWFREDGFRGCPFINAESEYGADAPTHGVNEQHRAWVQETFRGLCEEAGVIDPVSVARRLSLLYDGAMSSAQSEPRVDWALEAKVAATVVVRAGIANNGIGGN